MQICIYIHIFACVLECTRRFKLKKVMHACVKIYIDTYIRLCVRAQYALRRRYVTMCIIVYNIYAQKDTNTCTIKVYADAHASFTRAWSNACSNSSLHIYVLQSCYTN